MTRYVRTREAAEMIGLRPQTLNRWRTEGSPIPFSKLGKAVVYDVADIQEYVASRKQRSTSQAPAGEAPSTPVAA